MSEANETLQMMGLLLTAGLGLTWFGFCWKLVKSEAGK